MRLLKGLSRKAVIFAAVSALCMGFSGRAPAAGAQTWAALQEAIDRAGDGEIITLSEDVTARESDAELTVGGGRRLTLDLNGKTIIPFTTHEGSGLGSCVKDVKKAYPNATVTGEFSIYGHDVREGKNRVEKWLK